MGSVWSHDEIDEFCYTEYDEKLERELLDILFVFLFFFPY
jgi:hypothetical protein